MTRPWEREGMIRACLFGALRMLAAWLVVLAVLLLAGGGSPALAQGGTGLGPTPPPPVNPNPGKAVLHPLGVGLAALFVVLMVTLFRWMFRVPRAVPLAVAKARQSVSALHRILVPAMHDGMSERAVELACRLGAAQKAEIVLAYVIEVPFTLSLDTAVLAEEARGQEALRTAQFIVEQHGLPVMTRLIPHRYAWGGILALAREAQADAIVMGVGTAHNGHPEELSRTAQEVLKRAECEVILDRRPPWRAASA